MFCVDYLTFPLSLLMYSWIPFISALIQQMLKEKEAKIKEIMFIMGFQPRLFWLGYTRMKLQPSHRDVDTFCSWTMVALLSGSLVSHGIVFFFEYQCEFKNGSSLS